MRKTMISNGFDDTLNVVNFVFDYVKENTIICLYGDLGSGKTYFTKEMAKKLGIKESITSPTFTIVKEYDNGLLPLYHMDLYRIEESDIGVDDYFKKGGVCIIEWADYLRNKPTERIDIYIKYTGEYSREFIIDILDNTNV